MNQKGKSEQVVNKGSLEHLEKMESLNLQEYLSKNIVLSVIEVYGNLQ